MQGGLNLCNCLVSSLCRWRVVIVLDDCVCEVVYRERLVLICECRKDDATMLVFTDVENRVQLECPIHTLL